MTSNQCEPGVTLFGEIHITAIAQVTKKKIWLMVIHATFKDISVISWLSVLLVWKPEYQEKTTDRRKSLTNFIT